MLALHILSYKNCISLVKHDGNRKTLLPRQQPSSSCDWLNVESDLLLCLVDSERSHNKLVGVSSANKLDFFVCSVGRAPFSFGRDELSFRHPRSHVHIAVMDGIHSVVVVDPGESSGEYTTGGTTGSGW